MGVLAKQKKVKLAVSMIFRHDEDREYAEGKLKKIYGLAEPFEKTLSFDSTDYYFSEFGRPLERKLICFKRLVGRKDIAGIKLKAIRIEDRLRRNGKRTVNIDPGYITEAKLVLLTTKDYTHRVHVGRCIFAESTLFFRDGTFNPWPWTYPDYARRELISYFNGVRDIYVEDLKRSVWNRCLLRKNT